MPFESRTPEPGKPGEFNLPLAVFFPALQEIVRARLASRAPRKTAAPVVPIKTIAAARREVTASPPPLPHTVLPHGLTAAEYKAFKLAIQGMNDKDICAHLNLALSTVKNSLRDVRKKCGVKTTAELIARYARIEPAPLAAPLSKRQKDILLHLAAGQTNAQIAAALGISSTTVKTHLTKMHGKITPSEPGNRRGLIPLARAHQAASHS
ncbi:MAG: LuxR C-terminal-related transcriptional regulator [Alphaproteobacteria bacterium]